MDEYIDFLEEARKFSTLDANSESWKLVIGGHDRKKTVFTSHHGLFQLVQIQTDVEKEPMKFQLAMDVILSLWK